jgi:hypothetical protein
MKIAKWNEFPNSNPTEMNQHPNRNETPLASPTGMNSPNKNAQWNKFPKLQSPNGTNPQFSLKWNESPT